jgi:hypothetical protein
MIVMMMMMIIVAVHSCMYVCMYVMFVVLGPTDPVKAPTGSLRNMMFLNWQSLGEQASYLAS